MTGFALRFQNFQGEVPRLDKRTLGDMQAQVAKNALLTSGSLTPIASPKLITSAYLVDGTKTVYRMFDDSGSYWLSWDSDVDVVKGPIVGDERFRIFFTSDAFEPCYTDLSTATSSPPYPTAAFVLGIPTPETAPAASQDGTGSGVSEERAYVYTIVDNQGWESAPSPASGIVTGKPDAVWTISGFDPVPPNSGSVLSATYSEGRATLVLDTVFCLRQWETLEISGIPGLSGRLRIIELDSTAKTVVVSAPSGIGGSTGTWSRGAPHRTTDMVRRLYRTVTTSAGTDYYFVKEFGFGVLSVVDDAGANVGEPIATSQWQMPPANLHGLRMHGSGALVGFVDNKVWMSEPLSVYAFNSAYSVTSEHDIVGLGVIDTIVVACTKGRPMMWQGVAPESMAPIRMRSKAFPCLSKRSIVDGDSVLYASTEGPVEITSQGASLAAANAFTAAEWQRFAPETMVGEMFDGLYFLVHGTDAVSEDEETIIVAGGSMVRFTRTPTALYTDPETGLLYLVINNLLYEWNADPDTVMSVDWQSKEMVSARPLNIGAAVVDGEFTLTAAERAALIAEQESVRAANRAMIAASSSKGSFNAVSFNTLSFNGSLVRPPESVAETSQVVFSLFVRGEMIFSKVVTDNRVIRPPMGRKYDAFSVRVSGPVKIRSVAIAETPRDLAAV